MSRMISCPGHRRSPISVLIFALPGEQWIDQHEGASELQGASLNQLEFSVLKYGEVEAFLLKGALMLGSGVNSLREKVENLAEHGDRRFVFDLTELTRVDSSGIGLLVEVLYAMKKDGGSLKLVNPSKQVMQTLKMCSLLALFEIYTEQPEAIASFAQG